ncbi:hypothetical protein DICSQDRAFT_154199 [Dichomitus squalens LYAD-421 SS1]|uniref:uncharacterized protein n=1 Tax=Dichomitus squalens (strain LYAD-421) TaxID=732165 RepID=UPI0004411ECD|nr:uncharacterized protein DICSQDRAFT_154199 [Dichomitus squalens LYAD-421 SS1]EJF62983.1 hypothetical protein DICSQDRAFT_154199 [Dichomitus squalens LYAD-421 SS1]
MSTVKSKKEGSKAPIPPPTMVAAGSTTTRSHTQEQMKKVSRRASKPIINWFQRKLAGTVRTRRVSESQRYGAPSPRGKDKHNRRSSVPMAPPLALQPRARSNTTGSRQTRAHSLRGTISLNETDSADSADSGSFRSASDDGLNLSVARDSLYSPTSHLEADEDASVRPLPPSSPPSPSPSRSSSSYLSHSRTFRSMAASTKPTTLLSVDLTGGMAHIAQAPPTPTTPSIRIPPNIRTHSSGLSAGSVTFSAILPPSPTHPSRPSSGNSGAAGSRGPSLTAPLYTAHHPRNNPRPSSPPPDDASVLTLASSAFGFPGARFGAGALTLSGRGSIADDSVSQWSNTAGVTDSTSHFMMGDLEEGLGEERYTDHDVDASVRALRPRSSRRGSWESATSGWSANVALPSPAGVPSPGVRSKSMWASGSYRTGGLSTEDGFGGMHDDGEDDLDAGEDTEIDSPPNEVTETESDAPTNQSVTTVDAAENEPEAEKQAVSDEVVTSKSHLPGQQARVPPDLASTVTLPGSKVASETPSLENTSIDGNRSGAAAPTKPDTEPVELAAATGALRLEQESDEGEPQELEVDGGRRASAILSPLSPASTTHTEYLSAPSTPAPRD